MWFRGLGIIMRLRGGRNGTWVSSFLHGVRNPGEAKNCTLGFILRRTRGGGGGTGLLRFALPGLVSRHRPRAALS
jgi:hypothetical protein